MSSAIPLTLTRTLSGRYGWTDLGLGHGFHQTKQGVRYTLGESARRTVLARLLARNHRRNAEAVEGGMHDKGRSNAGQTEAIVTTGNGTGHNHRKLF